VDTPSDALRLNQRPSGFRRFRGAFGLSKAITIRSIIYRQSAQVGLNKFPDEHDYLTEDVKAPNLDIGYSKTNFSHVNQVNGTEPTSAPLKRRLAAVLLADVVGYSRLMSIDEENTHVALADYAKDVIEPKVAARGGRLIRNKGDSFLAEFDSAMSAVRCGLDVQDVLADHNAALPADRRIQLRIGINTGDVIVDEHDIYGNSVNIAARLEGLAEPGEIYVTRGVRDQLEGHPGLLFEDRGERKVKNIRAPIRVYRVQDLRGQPRPFSRELTVFGRRFQLAAFRFRSRATVLSSVVLATAVTFGAAGLPAWRDQALVPPRASLVVLPFSNFSGDPEQDYLADAVTDDLTTDLSRLPGAFVIASATAFTYRGRAVDVRQIGQECKVRYLLEGSIRRSGTRVQTNARLVDTSSAAQIWGDRFENEFTNLTELQDAITGRIASSLNIELVKAENRRAIAERPADPDATDLRLHAMALLVSPITHEHHLAARRYLEESLRLDPQSAESWSQLAHVMMNDYYSHWLTAEETLDHLLQRAADAAETALRIDPTVAMAHQADGLVRRARGDHQGALDSFDRAIQLDPNFARAWAQKANELVMVGRPNEAPPLALKAISLSPRDPAIPVFYWIIGRAYFVMGKYNDAITWLRKSVELRDNAWYSRAYLVSAYALTGRDKQPEAIAALNEFKIKFSEHTVQRIRAVYEKENPQSDPGMQASIRELSKGLLSAGVREN